MTRRPGRRAVLFAVTAVVASAAACGTRVDRTAYLRSLDTGGVSAATTDQGAAAPASTAAGPGAASTPGGPARAGAGTDGVTNGASTTGAGVGSAGPSGGGSRAAQQAAPQPPTGLSTQILGKTVVIGMHLPETGAAPLPMSWETDLGIVQQYMNDHPVAGRTMRFVTEDDGYDPATGMAACQKLVDSQPLLVIGHTSPAVETECAGVFAGHHIPYLMRGIPRSAIAHCTICYFGTPSDDLQGRLLADYTLDRLGGAAKKIGVVWANDQPVTKDAFGAELAARHAKVAISVSSVPRQPDFSSIVVKLQQAGAQIVLLSMPPVDAIKLSVQAQSLGFHPTWIGGGTYWNYNMTVESAGMAMDGAVSFSPWPSIDSAAAESWRSVYAHYRPGQEADDVGLVIWGWANLVRAALEQAGPNLSRASFVAALNRLNFSTAYWNPTAYSSSNRLGPTSVAVMQADGQSKRWRQISGFTSSF